MSIFTAVLKKLVVFPDAASGLRSPYRGGNANNGGNAGCEYANLNYAPSNANANASSPQYLSTRDVCSPGKWTGKDHGPRRKINTSKTVLVGRIRRFERSQETKQTTSRDDTRGH